MLKLINKDWKDNRIFSDNFEHLRQTKEFAMTTDFIFIVEFLFELDPSFAVELTNLNN